MDTRALWVIYINARAQQIENSHRAYVANRIASLRAGWNNLLAQNPSPAERVMAGAALDNIGKLEQELKDGVYFKRDQFTKKRRGLSTIEHFKKKRGNPFISKSFLSEGIKV